MGMSIADKVYCRQHGKGWFPDTHVPVTFKKKVWENPEYDGAAIFFLGRGCRLRFSGPLSRKFEVGRVHIYQLPRLLVSSRPNRIAQSFAEMVGDAVQVCEEEDVQIAGGYSLGGGPCCRVAEECVLPRVRLIQVGTDHLTAMMSSSTTRRAFDRGMSRGRSFDEVFKPYDPIEHVPYLQSADTKIMEFMADAVLCCNELFVPLEKALDGKAQIYKLPFGHCASRLAFELAPKSFFN